MSEKSNTVALYPNPASEMVAFNLNQDANVTIFDMSGRMVSEMNVSAGAANYEVSNLENGVYFVNFRFADGSVAVTKFVKM